MIFLRNSPYLKYYKITMCVGQEETAVPFRNSSHLAYYKITTCGEQDDTGVFLKEFIITYYKITISVGQEETVVFLKEFIKTILIQKYYPCRIGGKYRTFGGILKGK